MAHDFSDVCVIAAFSRSGRSHMFIVVLCFLDILRNESRIARARAHVPLMIAIVFAWDAEMVLD